MHLMEIFFLALGLAMDATAVSIVLSIQQQRISLSQAAYIALSFGIFQGGMPVLGWLAGLSVRRAIEAYDHWVALAILTTIGLHMIWESFYDHDDKTQAEAISWRRLIFLSVATSIDALAVGVSFSVIQLNIFVPIIVIAVVTFLLSLLSLLFGKVLGYLLARRAELIGGVILIAIGIHIVYRHIAKGI